MTNEEFYDAEIAPALLDLCRKCQEREMAFCATVEYDPPTAGIGRTEYQPPTEPVRKVSSHQLLVHWAARCKGNVDALISAIDRNARKNGHSSVYLQMLGNENLQYGPNETAAIAIISQ